MDRGHTKRIGGPFEIDGGMAAQAYGAKRELADIDINVSEKDFYKIVPKVKEYIHFCPQWFHDDHWECLMMTIKYAGQNIDISQVENMKYFDTDTNQWVRFPSDLSDVRIMEWMGMKPSFINEVKLMIYKQQLGRGVDKKDIKGMLGQLEGVDTKSAGPA